MSGVTTYAIDPEHTSFTVAFKPTLPGMRARVGGVRGTFDAAVTDGAVDWDQPVAGAFSMHVDDLDVGNGLFTAGARTFLDRTRNREITGTLAGVTPEGPHAFTCDVAITLADRTVRVRGRGRFHTDADGDEIRVAGRTLCDPRAFGVPLPPLVNFMVNVHWKLALRPV